MFNNKTCKSHLDIIEEFKEDLFINISEAYCDFEISLARHKNTNSTTINNIDKYIKILKSIKDNIDNYIEILQKLTIDYKSNKFDRSIKFGCEYLLEFNDKVTITIDGDYIYINYLDKNVKINFKDNCEYAKSYIDIFCENLDNNIKITKIETNEEL